MTNEPTGRLPQGAPPPPPPPPPVQQPSAFPPGPSPQAPAASGVVNPSVNPSGASTAAAISGVAWWSVVAIVALALAVSIEEDGDNGWGRIGIWAGFAIAAAGATLAPSLREQLKLGAETAWRVAAAGGIGLVAFWVLFVLPVISDNVSFLATVGCAAGAYAAWNAPGRPGGDGLRGDAPGGGQAF